MLKMSPAEESDQHNRISGNRWAMLLVSLFAFMAYAFVFQSLPPLLNELQGVFGVDDAAAGFLMSFVVVPGIFLALPAGVLINRFGFRRLSFVSIISVAIGSLVTAFSTTFLVALVGRLILGVGGCFVTVGIPTFIPQWFERREMGRAMGVYSVGMPIATTSAFFAAPILAQSFGWQSPFYIGFVVSMVSAVLFLAMVKEGPLKGSLAAVKYSEIGRALMKGEVWRISFVWMFFSMASIGFLTWAPKLFVLFKNLPLVSASILSSGLMIAAFFVTPFYGLASDRLGRRKPFIIAGAFVMALSLFVIGYAYDLSLTVSIMILGVSASAVPPFVMVIIAQSLSPKLVGTGFGIATLWQYIGITVAAPLIGYFFQTTQSLPLTFLSMSAFAFASAVTAITLRAK
jgi:MFS family permease